MTSDSIMAYNGIEPAIDPEAIILPGARVVGNVTIGAGSSVWFNSVIRGDETPITIGEKTNIQDLVMIHSTKGISETHIGNGVTVGHAATLHGCIIEDNVLIGMGAIVLDNARIGEYAFIGAGAMVTGGTVVPPRTLWLGSPAKMKRELRPEEIESINVTRELYHQKALGYTTEK